MTMRTAGLRAGTAFDTRVLLAMCLRADFVAAPWAATEKEEAAAIVMAAATATIRDNLTQGNTPTPFTNRRQCRGRKKAAQSETYAGFLE
jgi:hypothetical protein